MSGMADRWVVRVARLLEVGVYADKGVVITPEVLRALVRGFRAPVPLWVEHRPSPVVFGWVVSVWQDGSVLWGRVALYPEADALLHRLRVRTLSVGLSRDLRQILEVSLTGSPRIPSAQLFTSRLPTKEVCTMEHTEMSQEQLLERRVRELEQALRQHEIRERVQRWVQSGQLLPCQVPFAEAILSLDESTVQFSGTALSVAELFAQFVESQPPKSLLGELAPVPSEETPALSQEALEFLSRVFPDINPHELVRHQKEVR